MNADRETIETVYPALGDDVARRRLAGLRIAAVPAGTVLFRPGDDAGGFVLVLEGQVGVFLTGAQGRDIRLYGVGPGRTCIQTTLGLMGGDAYSGEAVAETDLRLAVIARADFLALLDESPAFRGFVFKAFGARMQDITRMLEQVAFVRVEARLAAYLVDHADRQGAVHQTHQVIATGIGTVREVVSRRLDAFRLRGLVQPDRGSIRVVDRDALSQIAREARGQAVISEG